ncbi:hypothetical protein BDN71DRAFT_1445758 [Pleurotus eryngii]|uniref:Uncharacterized protein n=1 Tax=Pleurotus eryngii TaxID=5323 RepID=A0A9P5ZYG3_PLEER|nr:hypothetical protein BDN71DRAFT_1445758 [Pleurotus eryngii]
MPLFLAHLSIWGENEVKGLGPDSSFVPDVFFDVNTEECVKSTVSVSSSPGVRKWVDTSHGQSKHQRART